MAALGYPERKRVAADSATCAGPGCTRPCLDDSALCEACREVQRAANRALRRRQRKRARRQRRCVDCPADAPRLTRGEITYCTAHRIRRNRLRARDRALAAGVGWDVDREERIAAATSKDPDGRTRHRGQGKRGSQPPAQLNRQDLGMARAALVAGETGLRLCETAEVIEMPRIQRENVVRAALHQLELARGHLADVIARAGHARPKHGIRCGAGSRDHVFDAGRPSCRCGEVAAPEQDAAWPQRASAR